LLDDSAPVVPLVEMVAVIVEGEETRWGLLPLLAPLRRSAEPPLPLVPLRPTAGREGLWPCSEAAKMAEDSDSGWLRAVEEGDTKTGATAVGAKARHGVDADGPNAASVGRGLIAADLVVVVLINDG
jgi:hypothetical protein